MFEPQDYPNDFQYAGGPPIAPYDNAGYTLAYSMGVEFDRILEPFSANLEVVQGMATPTKRVRPAGQGTFILDGRANDAYLVANKLMETGMALHRASEGFVLGSGNTAMRAAEIAASDYGITLRLHNTPPTEMKPIERARIALWDRYGGSMTSGWTRWLLEQFESDFDLIYAPDIDGGKLANYDVLILPSDASFGGGRGGGGQSDDPTIPEEWINRMGSLSVERSVPKIKDFLESGKTVVAIGGAGSIARHLRLPVTNHLVESVNGAERQCN
jgi:hypothetical protein